MKKGMLGTLGLAVALGLGCVAAVPASVVAPAAAYAEDVAGVTTLDELQVAVNNGGQVRLDADIAGSIIVPAGKTVTLDLNGHTLASDTGHTITNNGTLTIKGSGAVDAKEHGKAALVNVGTAELDGGTFLRSAEAGTYSPYSNGGNSFYTIWNRGAMTINGGTEVQNAGGYSSAICNGGESEQAILTINGGTFSGGVNSVKNDDHGTLTINGGNFSNTSQYVIMNWETATINDGSFKSLDTASAVLFNAQYGTAGKLTIKGGTFVTADSVQFLLRDYYDADHCAVDTTIEGGTFDGHLIKDNDNKGPLTITGGSFLDGHAIKFVANGNVMYEDEDYLKVAPESSIDASKFKYKVKADGGTFYVSDQEALVWFKDQCGATEDDIEQLKYTVTFDTNGHGTVDPVDVKVGSSVTLPAVPEVDGYTGAWYNGDTKVEGEFTPTSDVTLTAMWTKKAATKPGATDKGNGSNADSSAENPATATKAAEKTRGAMPQTGDNSLVAIVGVAVAGIIVIAGGVFIAKRRKN